MLSNLPESMIMANEGEEIWSSFDIVGHLIHGEKTDWKARIQLILSASENKTFTPFDRFAQFENSKGKNLSELLVEFEFLRNSNLEFFNSLNITTSDLDNTAMHPSLGVVTLNELLNSWATHDLSHINQITRVLAKQFSDKVGPWKEYLSVLHR